MPIYVKTGGAWRGAAKVYVKQGGSWHTVKEVYAKQGGVWRKVHTTLFNNHSTLPNNLLAHYRFNRGGGDSHNEYNLTVNSSTTFVNGKIDDAIYANVDSAAYRHNLEPAFYASTMAVAMWIYLVSDVGYQHFIRAGTLASDQTWRVGTTSWRNPAVQLWDTAGNSYYAYTSAISVGQWYFIYADWTVGGSLRISVNAGSFATGSAPSAIRNPASLQIGGSAPDIYVDSLSIWSGRKLTDAEISALYNSGNGLDY